jgi:hypothetical protein
MATKKGRNTEETGQRQDVLLNTINDSEIGQKIGDKPIQKLPMLGVFSMSVWWI